ncbi:MAG: Gfo/Idh/MocA family oxidoreductase [Methylocystaceae bacterium]|nr:Gfo/Idh/MocA family oxidoreductase [Methylocystaceae bacterium]
MNTKQNKNKIKVGLIGTGKISGFFADITTEPPTTHAQTITKLPEFVIAGVVDTDFKKAPAFAEKWGGDTYQDIQTMLSNIKCDLVVICTPDTTHADILKEIATHKSRPNLVIMEKPLCISKNQLDELKNCPDICSMNVIVNHSRRFDNRHKTLSKKIAAKTWGDFISAHWVYYGGWLHTGSHVIDTLQMLLETNLGISYIHTGFNDRADDPSLNLHLTAKAHQNGPIYIESFPEYAFQLFEGELRFETGRIRFMNFGNEIFLDEVQINDINERELKITTPFLAEGNETAIENLYRQAADFLLEPKKEKLNGIDFNAATNVMSFLFEAKANISDTNLTK